MKEVQLLFSNEVLLEDSKVMKLDYCLTEKLSEMERGVPYYGVKIVKNLDNLTESDEVNGISTSKDVVLSIIRRLCQFEVTPISMVEVLDDLVTQGI